MMTKISSSGPQRRITHRPNAISFSAYSLLEGLEERQLVDHRHGKDSQGAPLTILRGLDDDDQVAKLHASHLTVRIVIVRVESGPQRGGTFEIESRSVEDVGEVFLERLFLFLGSWLGKTLVLGFLGWWHFFRLTDIEGFFIGLAFFLSRLR